MTNLNIRVVLKKEFKNSNSQVYISRAVPRNSKNLNY